MTNQINKGEKMEWIPGEKVIITWGRDFASAKIDHIDKVHKRYFTTLKSTDKFRVEDGGIINKYSYSKAIKATDEILKEIEDERILINTRSEVYKLIDKLRVRELPIEKLNKLLETLKEIKGE